MEKDFSLNSKYITINPSNCRGCFGCRCARVCPQNIIKRVGSSFWHKHSAFINAEDCIGCMKCLKPCNRKVFTKRS